MPRAHKVAHLRARHVGLVLRVPQRLQGRVGRQLARVAREAADHRPRVCVGVGHVANLQVAGRIIVRWVSRIVGDIEVVIGDTVPDVHDVRRLDPVVGDQHTGRGPHRIDGAIAATPGVRGVPGVRRARSDALSRCGHRGRGGADVACGIVGTDAIHIRAPCRDGGIQVGQRFRFGDLRPVGARAVAPPTSYPRTPRCRC